MASSRGLRVLLIGNRGELGGDLEAHGHEVRCAADAPSALAAARSSSQDVVIVDLEGVGGDPFAFAREVRAAFWWRKPLFIAMGRPGRAECEECCRKVGIDLLLLEPVDRELVTGFLG